MTEYKRSPSGNRGSPAKTGPATAAVSSPASSVGACIGSAKTGPCPPARSRHTKCRRQLLDRQACAPPEDQATFHLLFGPDLQERRLNQHRPVAVRGFEPHGSKLLRFACQGAGEGAPGMAGLTRAGVDTVGLPDVDAAGVQRLDGG